MKTSEYREGKTKLLVPAASLEQDPPPTSPVFFNPAAALNRDVSVSVALAAGGSTFCDAMAGVGARGIRLAREVDSIERVTLVDFNPVAIGLARRSARLNAVSRKCEFSISESSAYLYSRFGRERRFDHVDVDPFGTPVRQLQAALNATADGGILSLTATDTAVLCGVYPRVSKRRYGGVSLNNSFNHETGIRILLGAVAREGASIDVGVDPVFAHSTRHYLRVFARVRAGAVRAEKTLGSMGYVAWCASCGHVRSSGSPEVDCEKCGRRARVAGPLWLGNLVEKETVSRSAEHSAKMGLDSAEQLLKSTGEVDSFPPWSFDVDEVCSALRVPTVGEAAVCDRLSRSGRRAMRTPFEKTGVKTGATYAEVVSAVRGAASGRGARPCLG